jgi:hypothetical protein
MGRNENIALVKKALLFAFCIFVFISKLSGQYYSSDQNSISIIRPLSLSGKVYSEGFFEYQKKENSRYTDYPRINSLIGGLKLDTESYILHPNFLKLDIDGELNSALKKSYFYVFNNRSETKSNQRLGINGTFFDRRKVKLHFNTNYLNGLKNNDDVARIKVKTFSKGVGFTSSSRYFPFIFNINHFKVENKNLFNNQYFKRDGINMLSRYSKSFSSRDFNQLLYNYQTSNEIRDTTLNRFTKIHKTQILNRIFLDKKKKYTLNSNYLNRIHISRVSYRQHNLTERIYFKLPYRMELRADYSYQNFNNSSSFRNQHDIKIHTTKKLYKSLETRLLFQKTNSTSSFQNEKINQGELGIAYTKKIPKGRLYINYNYRNINLKVQSNSSTIYVNNEEHILSDGEIELLGLPYVNTESIVVTDISGTIIYQRDFDYIVIDRENYTEIQRIPGGQIVNNSIVFVSYPAIQQGDYSYTTVSNLASIRFEFFKGLIRFHYNYINNDYSDLYQTELLKLNYLIQHQYGIGTKTKYFSSGLEYIDRQSTITPYKLWKVFVKSNYQFNRYSFSLNANIKNYLFTSDLRRQKYYDISGIARTHLTSNSSLNLTIGYSLHEGIGIFMNLLNTRVEYNLKIKQLELTGGLQYYHRYLELSKVDFGRFYFKVYRKF